MSEFEPIDALVFTGDQAAELRALLCLPDGANEEGALIRLRGFLQTQDALLDTLNSSAETRAQMRLVVLGDFEEAFNAARVLGLVSEASRAYWRGRFADDHEAALAELRTAAQLKGTAA